MKTILPKVIPITVLECSVILDQLLSGHTELSSSSRRIPLVIWTISGLNVQFRKEKDMKSYKS